ncbi:MAG: hypothetical protein LBJ72_06055 [Dysgonamonadaceae bacterium]|jgi:hypothetical protein|nr:hypothetical protein [Dysgonamonadaceae bacterium]
MRTSSDLFTLEGTIIDTLRYIYNNLPEQSKTGLMGKLAFKQIENFGNEKELLEDGYILRRSCS